MLRSNSRTLKLLQLAAAETSKSSSPEKSPQVNNNPIVIVVPPDEKCDTSLKSCENRPVLEDISFDCRPMQPGHEEDQGICDLNSMFLDSDLTGNEITTLPSENVGLLNDCMLCDNEQEQKQVSGNIEIRPLNESMDVESESTLENETPDLDLGITNIFDNCMETEFSPLCYSTLSSEG
jgi:hypothetical protein